MNLIDKLAKQPVYIEGDSAKYRTNPSPFKVFKKVDGNEIEIKGSDKGFCDAIAYNGSEITKEEYQTA